MGWGYDSVVYVGPCLHCCHCTNQIKVRKKCRRPKWPRESSRTKLEDFWLPDVNSYKFRLHKCSDYLQMVDCMKCKDPRKRRCYYDYPIYGRWCYNSAGERMGFFNKYCLIKQTYTWEKEKPDLHVTQVTKINSDGS